MPVAVADSLSNRPEHIVELARIIGKGQKRQVFAEVYRGQKQTKSVAEIAAATGLSEVQVLKAGTALVAAHAITQTKIDGRVAYSKIPSHKAIKGKVLEIAGDNSKIASISTKRSAGQFSNDSVFKPSSAPVRRSRVSAVGRSSKTARVAFLLASPAGAGAINVGMDYREASAAVSTSVDRNRIDLKPFPAAHAGTILDALNEYRPNVIHFSGHGGGGAILLDRDEIMTSGGMVLDYDVAKRMVESTDNPPTLLVFAACQTVVGVEQFLSAVPFVIAMSDNISDWAAAFFSRRFYGALVAKVSVGHAFDQAKAYLAAEKLRDADLPTMLCREGADAYQVRIVN